MAYVNQQIEVSEEILNNVQFIEWKKTFLEDHPNLKMECGNGYIFIKGSKRQVQHFKDYISNFYDDTSIHKIKLRNGKSFKPLNDEQKTLIDEIVHNDITFISGSAGTGKTMVSVIIAAYLLKKRRIDKLILTRPAVEAGGEKIGFLPGDIKDKMLPYLMPLYDYLEMMFTKEEIDLMESDGRIEIIPLSFMRGRSLQNSIILVDEAQNATYEQIKMISTRIGFNSKIVFSGDVSQNDMQRNQESGLAISTKIFKDINGIGIMQFSDENIVRHPIIKELIKACDELEHKNEPKKVLVKDKELGNGKLLCG